jgi:UDP-sugar transporter A1/2/3
MLDGAETKDAAARRLRAIVLGLLVFENSLTALCAKASRVPHPGQVMYAGSVAVLLSELLKITSCFGLIAREEGGLGKMLSEVKSEVFGKGRDSLVMAVPAMCFFVQNLLFYVALSRLSAVSYQLLCQTKTLTTAFFFVTLLGRVLTRVQWVALCLLSAGVGLVQLSDAAAAGAVAAGTGSAVSAAVGVGAVLVSAVLSGFAGVYTEKVVKTTPVSLWMRNAQLGLFSLPPALAVLFANRSAIAANGGLFAGFTPIVWAVVSIKGVGGLLNAACIKHADNILRSYATAASIVLTFAVRIVVTGEAPALAFVQGAGMVLLSVILYSRGAAS